MKSFLEDVAREYSCDPASVALSWIIEHPSNIVPVVGTNNLERISKLIEALKLVLIGRHGLNCTLCYREDLDIEKVFQSIDLFTDDVILVKSTI